MINKNAKVSALYFTHFIKPYYELMKTRFEFF